MASTIGFQSFFEGLDRKLEPAVKSHLKNVYSTMAMALLAAAIGGYLHLYSVFSGGLVSSLGLFGFALALWSTPGTAKNRDTRLLYLLGFGLCSGLSMGPLLDFAIVINPSLIPTTLISTCVIFGCFTLSTLFADHRKYLYLGGTLLSLLTLMLFIGLINLFVQSRFLFDVYLYAGLFIFCGFICYDTARIIEKRRMGDDDYILHALDLFIDFVDVFKHLLVILSKRECDKERKRRR